LIESCQEDPLAVRYCHPLSTDRWTE